MLRHGELLADERTKAEIRQRMLNEELNHRVKNILAIIKSLVGHPVQDGRDIQDYVGSLQGRIQALAFAHDQVVRGDGGGSLADLLDAELTPYRDPRTTPSCSKARRSGSTPAPFRSWRSSCTSLCTNAAKYGSLSKAGRQLSILALDAEGGCGSNGTSRAARPSRRRSARASARC